MCARFSSTLGSIRLANRFSLNEPNGPPSELAPLSEVRKIRVLSSSPISSRYETTRPMWWSVCSRNAAYTSIWRAYSRRSSAERVSQAGTQSGRGESSVPGGTIPISIWRAKTSSRQRSQPRSNWPRYFSIHARST
jgi:hypothetical protein